MHVSILKQVTKIAMEASVIKSKFRGCLLGSLLGDCLGAPYEGKTITRGDRIIIQRYFDKLEDPSYTGPFRPYTDDTAMMKSVAKFLVDKPEVDYSYLAKLFVEEYFNSPRRGYGQNVVSVFEKLRKSKYEDVFIPAKEQFSGQGSYGNGGAMRIAPVALFYNKDYNKMLEVAESVTRITHSSTLGVNGALLQCVAIHQALATVPNEKIDTTKFIDQLVDKIKQIETPSQPDKCPPVERAYQDKMKKVQTVLNMPYNDELDEDVIEMLGNDISAYESVPTAIYCFLRAQRDIPKVETDNLYRRTIQYAITLGGDTDTIACMAGAIAGAYVGEEAINKCLVSHCEFHDEILELADSLFDAANSPC